MDPLAPIRTTQNPKYPNRTEPIPEMPRPSKYMTDALVLSFSLDSVSEKSEKEE